MKVTEKRKRTLNMHNHNVNRSFGSCTPIFLMLMCVDPFPRLDSLPPFPLTFSLLPSKGDERLKSNFLQDKQDQRRDEMNEATLCVLITGRLSCSSVLVLVYFVCTRSRWGVGGDDRKEKTRQRSRWRWTLGMLYSNLKSSSTPREERWDFQSIEVSTKERKRDNKKRTRRQKDYMSRKGKEGNERLEGRKLNFVWCGY